jgi:hypothetical protein
MTAAAERLLAEREFVAEWRDELAARMDRAQDIVETVGLSRDLHEALLAEAHFFIRICRALTTRIPGSLTGAADREERGAA